MDELYRTWAEIDLAALSGNFAAIRKRCGQKIYAVVKADAYGHGAVEAARFMAGKGVGLYNMERLLEEQ